MNFLTHKKRAASKLHLLDKATDTILTGRDIIDDDLEDGINDGYREVNQMLSSAYAQLYEIDAYTPNYFLDATVSSITDSTLVVDDTIFLTGHVGAVVFNYTKDNYSKIASYTATNTVELEDEMDEDASDGVHLLEKEFTFSSAITDYVSNLSMQVRYSPTSDYVPAEMKLYDPNNSLIASESHPIYVLKQINTSTGVIQGFEIFPHFEEKDDKAIHQRYIALPSDMSADGDTPKLPLGTDTFLFWKGVEYGAVIRKDAELASFANAQFEKGKRELLAFFKPLRNYNARDRVPSHYQNILRKQT